MKICSGDSLNCGTNHVPLQVLSGQAQHTEIGMGQPYLHLPQCHKICVHVSRCKP
ncbi:hypothetical protein PAXRUDRAFT_448331 [Paxillus rubicundulus Ve08.2h10]|uniref:Uncharacterized protein n=1 Tax=Paxillus rubicundulus Ve08.2h10 TaxID=930991 RepID=A0A0D0DWX5_9AGAM|nr:hypothetical protein PAXRUDRAFT_448331 [Paxillus rubicundulus Ve08.2h10]